MTGPPRDPRDPRDPRGRRDRPEPGNGGRGSLEGPPNGGRGSLEGPPPEPREPRQQPERPGRRARRTAKPADADATAPVPAVTADDDATATTPIGNGGNGGNGSGRAGRRQRAKRRKKRILAGVGALAIVAVAGGAFAVLSGGETHVKAAPPKSTTTSSSTATTTPLPPPSTTATSTLPKINAYDAPADTAKVIASFTDKTEYQQPRTFLVTERQPGWLHVLLPQRPNNTAAWIKESEVTLGESPFSIKIELGAYMVTLYKDGAVVLQTQAVVGKQQTPTPLGKFYITDPVDLQTRPNGAYGAYALGLSGYSEVLTSFNGGPGQIALHGTASPQQVGQNLSNGCIRIPNDVILQIVGQQVPLGTPVEITA